MASLFAACSGGAELGSAEGELRVTPSRLVFERGFAGYAQEARLQLVNTGRTELLVEVTIEGSFSTQAGPYQLAGGADVTKPIYFTPAAAGAYEGRVVYTVGGVVTEVVLAGTAEVPEICAAPSACVEVWFDPEAGGCRSRDLPERAACQTGNACLGDGICVDHECRGTPVDCNDGNACTDDTCDPASGCLHAPVRCPASPNLCQEAICKPDEGCTTRDVRDGTECGDNGGCIERHLCVGGECVTRGVPDGLSCNAPCGPGECHDQLCVREDAHRVDPPGWKSEPVATDRQIVFPGLASEDGVVVWFETALDGSGTTLAALAATTDPEAPFVQLYRDVPLDGLLGAAAPLIAGDRVVASFERPGGGRQVEARLLSDGSSVWSFAVDPALEVRALIDDGGGAIRLVGTAGGRTSVIPIGADLAAGPAVWLDGTLVQDPGAPGAVADADGRLYLTVESEAAGRRVISLYADGSPRWELPAEEGVGGPLAVAAEFLVLAPGRVVSTADGATLFAWPLGAATDPAGPAPSPLLGASAAYAVAAGTGAAPPALISVDPFTGEAAGTRELALEGVSGPPSWTAPILTARENAALVVQVVPEDDPTGAMLASGLLELRPDGDDARACLVPGLGRLAGPPVVGGGWFAFAEQRGSVKLYRLRRGADPAAWGWAGPHGGPGGGNREAR